MTSSCTITWLTTPRWASAADADGHAINETRRQWNRPVGGELPPIEGHLPRWLRPDRDFLERGPRRELQLHVPGEGLYRGVFALRCFPVHYPEKYVSLRF